MNYHMQVSVVASRPCQDKVDKEQSPDKWTKLLYQGVLS